MEKSKFLKRMFQEYYKNRFKDLDFPAKLEEREVGFLFWDNPSFQRHKSFNNFYELRQNLLKNGPKHAYFSAAYYEIPEAPKMYQKYWTGCDLIFDFDADHIPSKCQWEHDTFTCKNCGFSGKGPPPKTCKCGSKNFEQRAWICDTCLELAKNETIKIIEDFLIPDFSIDKNEIRIKFSGHRGYHIQISSQEFMELDQDARREIIDYIIGNGIDYKVHGLYEGDKKIVFGPNLNEKGWRRRIINYVFKFIEHLNYENYKLYKSLTIPLKKKLIENKQTILENLTNIPSNWNIIPGIHLKHWQAIVNVAIQKYGPKLDIPVTIDIHRLIRMDYSLHGKTGFMAMPIKISDIDKFDPLKDAVVFQGEIELVMKECPEFRVGDTLYGPYSEGTKEELSMAAGIFALCKNVAELDKNKNILY
ncbi:MAG: DNA primase small subunit domain-containing protein [Candidatus Helarchaeota archaeon]